jgi:hypothetical protein
MARRNDTVYVSIEFDVIDVRYLWDEARDAGSDHGLVSAQLALRD